MHESRTIFPNGLNGRVRDKFKTDNTHSYVATKFHLCKVNIVLLIVGKITKVFTFFHENIF